MRLRECVGVPTKKRFDSLRFLNEIINDWKRSREIEMAAHAISRTTAMYVDKMHQIIHNVNLNPELVQEGANVAVMSDKRMAANTIIENIEKERAEKQKLFEEFLQEKYDMVNRDSYRTTLRCRRCGSPDVRWEQKQTRGADEAMTVFCTCAKCQNRWTMR